MNVDSVALDRHVYSERFCSPLFYRITDAVALMCELVALSGATSSACVRSPIVHVTSHM